MADLKSYDTKADRNLIATVLLDAVEQSFKPHEHKARRWLKGIYAESLLILLDISPSSALQHLTKKWQKIDADYPTPGQWLH
ncbi:hypothetical protein HF671_12950 [Acidithiobacillus thiooxidans]|nr:hypothetical protein [Acidithiobacillus thiooxidans]